MEISITPVQDNYLIYRPLRKIAFIGNQAMVDLVLQLSKRSTGDLPQGDPEVLAFLNSIGFFRPDFQVPAAVNMEAGFTPTSAALLMTGRCNLRCVYCYASGGEKADADLPEEYACAAIDQVCNNAIALGRPEFDVTFHGGGEPSLAWKTMQTAAAYARSRTLPAQLSMVSNGIWSDVLLDWVTHNLDGVTISMDGRKNTQDAQRPYANGKGSFDAVMKTIQGLDRAGFNYHIRITSTPEYFKDLPGDVEFFCHETGCQNIQVEPCFHSKRGSHPIPSQQQADAFSEAFLSAYDIARETGHLLYYSGARPWILTRSFCSAPYGSALTINPAGEVVACYEITDAGHPLAQSSTFGQYDEQTSSFVIDQEKRKSFVSSLQQRSSLCKDCICFWHCAGDCYTRGIRVHSEDTSMPYARCAVNRQITLGLLMRAIAAGKGVFQGISNSPYVF